MVCKFVLGTFRCGFDSFRGRVFSAGQLACNQSKTRVCALHSAGQAAKQRISNLMSLSLDFPRVISSGNHFRMITIPVYHLTDFLPSIWYRRLGTYLQNVSSDQSSCVQHLHAPPTVVTHLIANYHPARGQGLTRTKNTDFWSMSIDYRWFGSTWWHMSGRSRG